MTFITRHARIRNYALYAHHHLLFKNDGNLDLFLDQAMKALAIQYPKYYKMDRLSKLGLLATEVLLTGTQLVADYGPESVALVLANKHASLDTDVRYFESTRTIASPALFVYTLTNIVSGEICIRQGFKGENAFFVTPDFDPTMLSGYVEMVMASHKTKACVAGWIDVMGEEHDVFLYLAEKRGDTDSLAHSSEVLRKLYTA
jgi:hypothetical protein